MTLETLIAEIERLDAEATKGPWTPLSVADGFLRRENQNFVSRARTLLPLCGRLLKVFARHTPDCKCYAKDDLAELAEILEAKND